MLDWLNGPNVAVVLFFIGLTGVILRKNMMITIIGLSIMNTAVITMFVTMGSSLDHRAPMVAETVAMGADPVPAALMITSVVIGVAVQTVGLVLILGHYRQHKTLDWDRAKAIREGRPVPEAATEVL